jgi:hypothetical protein
MLIMRKIERFLRQYKMPPTKFGRLAVCDPRLIHDMRRGRQFRVSMIRRVETFMAAYRDHREHFEREHLGKKEQGQ